MLFHTYSLVFNARLAVIPSPGRCPLHARSPSDAQSSQCFISCNVLPIAHTLCMHVVPKTSRVFLTLYTQIVLKMLKSLSAVLIITPGSCGCQCSSFMFIWPQCWNRSCGGTSGSSSSGPSSRSTLKSQMVIWLSAPDTARTLESSGFHSREVMSPVCCSKVAIGLMGLFWKPPQ